MESNDYRSIFLEEAEELIEVLDERLLRLEKDPNNMEIINDIFRVTHTLKSSSAFVNLDNLSSFCHKVENILDSIRSSKLFINEYITNSLFKFFDQIKETIERYASNNNSNVDYSESMSIIQNIITGQIPVQQKVVDHVEKTQIDNDIEISEDKIELLKELSESGHSTYYVHAKFEQDIRLKWVRAELVYFSLNRLGQIIVSKPYLEDFKSDKLDETLEVLLCSKEDIDEIYKASNVDQIQHIEITSMSYTDVISTFGSKKNKETFIESSKEDNLDKINNIIPDKTPELNSEEEHKSEYQNDVFSQNSSISYKKNQTVKVTIERLDELLNQVGELAIVNSSFLELCDMFHTLMGSNSITNSLKQKIDLFNGIVKNLQSGIMQSRMVPIGMLFNRFTKLIRDISKEIGKNVDFKIKGEDTELDKKIVDSLFEPLIHLIRNSIDHGIESEEERIAKGKQPVGQIILSAYQKGNQIYIEISDDGRGLNKDKILESAIHIGIIDEKERHGMTDQDIYQLIFRSGVSTKDKVTKLSGRGVGMGVVYNVVKKMNGQITIISNLDKETRFILSFPLTLAIIPAILVESRKSIYAIPLSNVVETTKIFAKDIYTIDQKEVIRIRDKVIPLLRLSTLLDDDEKDLSEDRFSIVIVEMEENLVGIVVTKLLGKREIVIKSLEMASKYAEGVSGATILGDGTIALILDTSNLIRMKKNYRIRA